MLHLIVFHLLWVLQTPSPVPPADFSQIGAWLIMPATLGLIANLVISGFFSKVDPNAQSLARLGSFLAAGLISFLLTKLTPDFVTAIQPLWTILDAVIAAFYTTQGIKGLWKGASLVALRLAIGRDGAKFAYDKQNPHG